MPGSVMESKEDGDFNISMRGVSLYFGQKKALHFHVRPVVFDWINVTGYSLNRNLSNPTNRQDALFKNKRKNTIYSIEIYFKHYIL